MDALKKLDYLSLVSKVCSELETHVGIGDKTLAEFLIEMGKDSRSAGEFDKALKENGAELPEYLVSSLLSTIHAVLPPSKKKAKGKAPEQQKGDFPGLALPNDKDRIKEMEREMAEEASRKGGRGSDRDGRDWEDGGGRDRRPGRRGWDDEEEDRGRGDGRGDRRRDGGFDDRGRGRDRYDDDDRQGGRRRDDYGGSGRVGDGRANGNGAGMSGSNPNELEVYGIYKGKVSRIMDFGCFVQIEMPNREKKEGLVHVSQIVARRVNNAKDAVERDQECYVKVLSLSGAKISLSMRDVDQKTGKDLLPMRKPASAGDDASNPSKPQGSTRGLSGIRIVEEDDNHVGRRPGKRMSSPERWEAQQLVASGVLDIRDHPEFDEEAGGLLYQEEGEEQDIEIELNEDEPAFLRGQTRASVDISPVKIVKNPDGSLQRAALTQSALSKERRELREQQQRTMLDSIPKDLNRYALNARVPRVALELLSSIAL